MLDDVAAVETIARPTARSPDTRAALAYLTASGATAISITADADGIAISVGIKRDAVAAYWLPETMVRSVAAKARNILGDAGGVEEAISALQEAAAKCAVTLTPNNVAISRATNAAAKLDRYLDSLQGSGVRRRKLARPRLRLRTRWFRRGLRPFCRTIFCQRSGRGASGRPRSCEMC
jgi:hypothetical protein